MKLMKLIGEIKKMYELIMLKMMFYVLLFHLQDKVKLRKRLLDLEWKIV